MSTNTRFDKKILRNRARCRKCNTIIESKHGWHFVQCDCKAIFLDGGKNYVRCGGYPEDIELLTEWDEPKRDPDEELEAA